MEKDQIKENLSAIPEIKKLVSALSEQFKAYFQKDEPKKDEPAKEEPKKEDPAPAKDTPKAEFDFAAEFKKITDKLDEANTSIEARFKTYDEKFTAFDADIKTAKDTISKQDDLLKKTKELLENLPTAFSNQKPKEGAKKSTPEDYDKEMAEWRKTYMK